MGSAAARTVIEMQRLFDQVERDEEKVDDRWSAQARADYVKGVRAKAYGQVEELRVRALAEIEAERTEAENQHVLRRNATGPLTSDEWAQAGTQAGFLREDLAKLGPGECVAVYRALRGNKDRLGAWVAWREVERELEARAANSAGDLQIEAGKALQALQALGSPWAEADRKLAEDRAELVEIFRDLSRGLGRQRGRGPRINF